MIIHLYNFHLFIKHIFNYNVLKSISKLLQDVSIALEKISLAAADAENELLRARSEAAASNAAYKGLVAAFLKAAGRRDQLLLQWEETLSQIQQKGEEETVCIEVRTHLTNLYIVLYIINCDDARVYRNFLYFSGYNEYSGKDKLASTGKRWERISFTANPLFPSRDGFKCLNDG